MNLGSACAILGNHRDDCFLHGPSRVSVSTNCRDSIGILLCKAKLRISRGQFGTNHPNRVCPHMSSRKKNRGAILIDALVGLFILGMGAIAYYGLLPVIHRAHEIAQQDSKAAQIAARVTEQVGMLKPSEINATTLNQLNLIDANQAGQPWTFSHIPLDDGTSYSPAKVLRNGQGTITTTNLSNSSVLVNVTVTWSSPSGASRSFSTGTVVGGYR